MAVAVFLAVDNLLAHSVLDFLVEVGVGESQQQPVGPRPARQSHFGDNRLVVVGVVEAFHVLLQVAVDAAGLEVLHGRVYVVAVVRVVLEGIDLVGGAVAEGLPEVEVRLVGIERPERVGGIGEPAFVTFLGDDVHHAADGIGAEPYGDDPLVDLDALGIVHGDVVQSERGSHALLGHSVDEDLDMLAAEPVHHEREVGAYAARFAQLQAGGLGQRIAQVLGGVLHLLGVDGHGVEGRAFHPSHAIGHHHHLVQLHLGSRQQDVHFLTLVGQADGLFHGFIADGRDHQRVRSGRCMEVIMAVVVRGAAVARPLEVDGGKAHRRLVFGNDFP